MGDIEFKKTDKVSRGKVHVGVKNLSRNGMVNSVFNTHAEADAYIEGVRNALAYAAMLMPTLSVAAKEGS
jgi:hypothetical protein